MDDDNAPLAPCLSPMLGSDSDPRCGLDAPVPALRVMALSDFENRLAEDGMLLLLLLLYISISFAFLTTPSPPKAVVEGRERREFVPSLFSFAPHLTNLPLHRCRAIPISVKEFVGEDFIGNFLGWDFLSGDLIGGDLPTDKRRAGRELVPTFWHASFFPSAPRSTDLPLRRCRATSAFAGDFVGVVFVGDVFVDDVFVSDLLGGDLLGGDLIGGVFTAGDVPATARLLERLLLFASISAR